MRTTFLLWGCALALGSAPACGSDEVVPEPDPCDALACANGGACAVVDEQATCVCVTGFAGATCAENLDDCAVDACANGGTCVDGIATFTCECPLGAWGERCEDLVEPLAITTTSVLPAILLDAYQQPLTWTGGTPAARWTLVDNPDTPWLSLDATGLLAGTPSAGDEGTFSVTVRVDEPAHPDNADETTFEIDVLAEAPVAYQTGFEGACPDGWTLTGPWECGVPANVGPAAFAGTRCLGTTIAGNYPDLRTWATDTATSPSIALPGDLPMHLTFRMWVDTEGATYDGANLSISTDGGTTYTVLSAIEPAYSLTVAGRPAWGGRQAGLGWQPVIADLSAYAGQTVRLRFAFQSDSSGTFPGVYVDELRIGY